MERNLYVTLREEQQKRLDVAMNAPVGLPTCCEFHGKFDGCREGRECPDRATSDVTDLCWALFAVALLLVPILAAAFFLVDNWPILVSLWSI